ncbi:hypothetical protein [Chondrinema litorale]|uniref:hypothetical protein n=1 Tax=Chondrinema litorale TaxID=2994555 RepID=UPI002543C36A|nr:hypothetical protein [Chondrinema litorale]UZR94916.1 hypothetical protein OQ292_03695 [Chondrinema litorale]
MKKVLFILLVLGLSFGVYIMFLVKEKFEYVDKAIVESKLNTQQSVVDIDYSKFIISKGKIGEIEIGMSITEAKSKLKQLEVAECSAYEFGFSGGSPAYLFLHNDKRLFALIPELGSEKVIFIVAIARELNTYNNLSPKSKVDELITVYPEMTINQDIMNSWEYFKDEKNNWTFNFKTEEEKTVGFYPQLEEPSMPHNLEIFSDWIVIR